ncbi:hypothetical protein [Streptomyces sp. NBC_01800]|nr:hypothetical protein [Streptomyces sp. NBC_01800]WSA72154.1 hypothetical protein OIE65_37310 [Streptomyces sp. NBC_01800]
MPRVAALRTDHALAGASRIRLADLGIGPEEVDERRNATSASRASTI